MPRLSFLPLIATAWLAAMLGISAAQAADPLGSDGALCRFQTERQGQLGGLPEDLLTAISLVESGRYDRASQAKTAWPWTVMAEGRGRYFPSKAEAVAEVRRLQARGIRNIDVGCMQINLFYHGDAFPNLETAFDPAANVAYAVDFLQSLRRETGSWTTAMTRYHSATPEYARRYKGKVEAELASLLDAPDGAFEDVAAAWRPAPRALLSDQQRKTLAANEAKLAAAKTEAEANRAAAREFAEKWRARRLAEYQAAKADRADPADAS